MLARWFAAVVFVAGLVAGCSPQTPEEKAQSEARAKEFDDEITVQILAEKAVKQFLKWPKDASFGWCPQTSFNSDRTAASVEGEVEAKNSFGATLTHDYIVLFVRELSDWKIDTVAVGNEIVYRRPEVTKTPPAKDKASESKKSRPKARARKKPVESNIAPDKSTNLAREVPSADSNQPKTERQVVNPDLKIWKDKSGKHTIEAEFVSMMMGTVKLKKKGGKTIAIPIEKLSEKDQEWIRKRGR